MKVILASSVAPFNEGGSTLLVEWLGEMLRERGHELDVLNIPFDPACGAVLEQMVALRLLDIAQHGDRLITIRTPSYLLRHPSKVLWFIHHYRGAYDLWGTRYQGIPDTPEGLRYRDSIMAADNLAFAEAKAIFSNSRVVADRLKRFNGVDAEVLYPAVPNPGRFHCAGFDDYFLYVSRLTHHKRQWLAIEAMRHTRTPVRLIIAGPPDPGSEPYAQELASMVEKYGLDKRVTIIPRWISEELKISLLAHSLSALYIPLDEDSYGFPSLEAHHSRKPVITAADSGGTRELVIDQHNGIVADPSPQAMAAAMDELFVDRKKAERMGEAGIERIAALGISWDVVLDRLLA